MLHEQKRRAEFTGGLEAARLRDWHVNLLVDLRPKQMFFAYDTKDDLEPLRVAGQKLLSAGFTRASHSLRCYVLMGWKGDTILNAESRMRAVIDAGFTPTGMLYRTKTGAVTSSWGRFQRSWFRPAAIYSTQRKG